MPVKHARITFAALLAVGLLLLALGGASAEPYPVVTDPLPIDHVDIRAGAPGPDGLVPVQAHIVAKPYGGGSCQRVLEPAVTRSGDVVTVQVLRHTPAPGALWNGSPIACTAMVVTYEHDLNLGQFAPGQYTLKVNEYTTSFTVSDGRGDVMLGPLDQAFARLFDALP